MKAILSILSVIALTTGIACADRSVTGRGSTTTDTRRPGAFTGIGNEGSVAVEVFPAAETRVEVSGYENLVAGFTSEVRNGTLHLHFAKDIGQVVNSNLKVRVYTPGLRSVAQTGSGSIAVLGGTKVLVREAELAGSGAISLEQAQCPRLSLTVAGSGRIQARSAPAAAVDATVTGSGRIETASSSRLDAHVTGSGTLHYWGEPQVSQLVAGSGEIVHH